MSPTGVGLIFLPFSTFLLSDPALFYRVLIYNTESLLLFVETGEELLIVN